MAIGNQIGSVYIKVKPDTEHFRKETQDKLGRRPIEVEAKVEVDDSELTKALDKMGKGDKITRKISFDPDYEGIRDAMRKAERELKNLERQKIDFEFDKDAMQRELDKLNRKLDESAAKIPFRADEQGYRDVLNKIKRIREEKLTETISLDVDDESLDRWEKDMKERLQSLRESEGFTFDITLDYDGISEGIRAIDQKLKELDSESIEVGLDRDSLEQARADLVDLRENAKVEMRITQDEAGYRSLLRRIEEIQATKTEVPVEFAVDEDSLNEWRRFAEEAIAELERTSTKLTFDVDYDGVVGAIDEVKRQLRGLEQQEIEFTADTESLNRALDDLEKRKIDSLATVKFNADETSHEAILKKIDAIRTERTTVDFKFRTDEGSLAEVEARSKAALEAMKRWASIEVTYTDDLKGHRELMRKIQELRNERVEITAELNVSDRELDEMLAASRNRVIDLTYRPHVDPLAVLFAEGSLGQLSRDRWVEIKPRINRRVMRDLQGAFLSIAGINTVGKLVEQIENVAMNFDEVTVAASSAGAAIGSLISVGTVSIGSLLSVAKDALQTLQGVAMAPTLLLSGASVLQTWKAIWSDFGAALMGIPGVLEKMPPNAQKAVKAIERLNKEVNQTVQNNFWGKMTDQVERFTDTIGPHIVTAMGQVATVMGKTVGNMLDHTERLAKSGQLAEFTKNNTRFMLQLGEAAETAFEALMDMGIRGSQYLPELGRWINRLSQDFKGFMDEAMRTGRFDLWIRNSINSIKSLGQFAKGTWDMLAGITKAFESVGGKGLHEMADGMERVATFVNSAGFQGKLQGIFRAAMDGATSVGRGFADLMTQLYDMDELVGTLLRQTGELAGTFMTQISKALRSQPLQKGLTDMFDGMIDFVSKAGPGFESIANIWGRLSSIGGEVAREIAHGMNLTMGVIDGFIERIQGPLINAIHPLTKAFEDVAALATPILNGLARTLGTLFTAFSLLPGPIQNIITLMGVLAKVGALSAFGSAMSRFTTGIAKSTQIAQRSINVFATQAETRMLRFQARMAVLGNNIGTGLRKAFTGLMGILGGPWGIALTAAIGVATAFAGAQAQAKADVDALTDALIHQGEAGARQTIFNQLKDDLVAFEQAGGNASYILDEIMAGRGDKVARELRDMDRAAGSLNQTTGLAASEQTAASVAYSQAGASARLAGVDVSKYGNMSAGAAGKMGKALEGTGGKLSKARIEADLYNRVIGETSDTMEQVAWDADRVPPKMQLLADAFRRVQDESSTTEAQIDALGEALDLLGNKDPSAEEFQKSATRIIDQVMKEANRYAKDKEFDWNAAFSGGALNLESIEGVELSDLAVQMKRGLNAELKAAHEDYSNGLISEKEYNDFLANADSKWSEYGRTVAKELGLSKDQTKMFLDYWNNSANFDEKHLRAALDGEGVREIKEEFELLNSLGMTWSQEKFTAEMDADGNGFVDEVEYANGLGKAFDNALFTAQMNGDHSQYMKVQSEALAKGYFWDGEKFVATLGADGTPTDEGLKTAMAKGYIWNGSKYIATFGADKEPTEKGLKEAMKMGYVWDGEKYTSALDANNKPTSDALKKAQAMGLRWDGEKFVADVDADPKKAEAALIKATNKGEIWDGEKFIATVDADGKPTKNALEAATKLGLKWDGEKFVSTIDESGSEKAKKKINDARKSAKDYVDIYEAALRENGGDKVKAKADAAKAAADKVKGTRTANFKENGSSTVTSKSKTASREADKVKGTRNAKFNGTGTSSVVSNARRAARESDKVKGTRTSTLKGRDWATGVIKAAVNWLASFKDKTVTLTTKRVTWNVTKGEKAPLGYSGYAKDGGIEGLGSRLSIKPSARTKFFANGGFENHVAQITSPTTPLRIWSEPETGGEAYIPMSSSKRTRSLAIWQEVGRRFGVFEDGGITGSSGTGNTTNVNVVNNYPRAEPTSKTVREGLEYAAAFGMR